MKQLSLAVIGFLALIFGIFIPELLASIQSALPISAPYIQNGSSIFFFPLFSATKPPSSGSLTQVNFTGASANNTGDMLFLSKTADAAESSALLVHSTPATPYTITMAVKHLVRIASYNMAGFVIRQSSDGKLVQFCIYGNQDAGHFRTIMGLRKMTNATTFSADYLATSYAVPNPDMFWYRLADNGTNRTWSYSLDGTNFYQVATHLRTDFLTADQVGIFVNPFNATEGAGITVFSWLEN